MMLPMVAPEGSEVLLGPRIGVLVVRCSWLSFLGDPSSVGMPLLLVVDHQPLLPLHH